VSTSHRSLDLRPDVGNPIDHHVSVTVPRRRQKERPMNRGGFSWKRALGITNAKRKVSRATGIPWSKTGRQRKVGAMFWKLFK